MRFRLIPRDPGFFPVFDQQATLIAETARLLVELFASSPIDPQRVESIVAAERTGDALMRDIRGRLEVSLVTPFDREDIQMLASSMDDVLDEMRAAADSAHLHSIKTVLPGVTGLVELLHEAAVLNVSLVAKLSTLRGVNLEVDQIDDIESAADAAFRRIMADLFDGTHDALAILKWKDVVESIERAINALEDASDVIQSIALKHA